MAKPEWGGKRTCQSCGVKFYDFLRDPITCPACGTRFEPEAALRTRRSRAEPRAEAAKVKAPVPAFDEELEDEEEAVDDEAEELDDDEELEDADEADDDTVVEEEGPRKGRRKRRVATDEALAEGVPDAAALDVDDDDAVEADEEVEDDAVVADDIEGEIDGDLTDGDYERDT